MGEENIMKKILSLALLLTLCLSLSLPAAAYNDTGTVGIRNTFSLSGGYTSALDKNGNLMLNIWAGGDTYFEFPAQISSMAYGAQNRAYITTDGSLWMGGNNKYGQLGNGSNQTKTSELVKVMDNVAAVSRPLRVSGKTAFFEHDRNLIFPAANEFRRFEMVTTNYNGMGIEQYSFHEPYYHATLKTDRPRSFLNYIYDRTQYGRFTVRGSDVYDSETGADYMVVHFALQSPPLSGGKLYVDGEFTQHNFTGSNQMHYNSQTGCYEASLMLKQGAYNYQYLWVPDGSQVGKADEMEGNYYQTVNEYQILVYNRKRGERYDRLIGYNIIYSGI